MVDIKCNFLNEKHKTKENASNLMAQYEDESLLRQPLQTSFTGFSEAKKAFENGTDEVRHLLMQECSLIYECNVCRNMFRCFENFISHKRHYCKLATTCNFHTFRDKNSTTMLVQNVECSEPFLVKSRSTGSSPIQNSKLSNHDLSKVIERLKRVEVSSDCNEKPSSVECKKDLTSSVSKSTDTITELECVSTTTKAQYQTLKSKKITDCKKTELTDEVNKLLANKNSVFVPDSKADKSENFVSFKSLNINNVKDFDDNNCLATQLLKGIFCEICKMSFQTEKTLKTHMQNNHTSTSYVFQCPTCSMTFIQPAAVIRHLANEHKKPLRRLRKMRDSILKKRIQIDDVQVNGLSPEVVKCRQITNTKNINSSNINDQQNVKSVSSCSYCLKSFERRAALASHLINCSARKYSLPTSEITKNLSDSNQTNIKTKIKNQTIKHLLNENNQNETFFSKDRIEINAIIKQETLEDINVNDSSSNINKLFKNLENQTFGNGLQTVCLENIQMVDGLSERICEQQTKTIKDCTLAISNKSDRKKMNNSNLDCHDKASNKDKPKRLRVVPTSKQLTCRCKICNKQFNALSNLRRHISMFHYRSKRFGCNFCDYRAFRRYDIVNHLSFVHKMIGERETMAVNFVTVHELKYSKDDVEGDILVVNDEAVKSEQSKKNDTQKLSRKSENLTKEITLKTFDKKDKYKKELLLLNKDSIKSKKKDLINQKDKTHLKVVRRKFKKCLETQSEGKKRPIRNRIKTVNKDFVYDLPTIKEESKIISRLLLKRKSTNNFEESDIKNIELAPPSIKILPYRLRTEPLLPVDKSSVKGAATTICRHVIHEGLAACSTLPELPTERPQMRHRLISYSRTDSNSIPIIETSELEAAGLKSTFFDDSFLEKFAKKSNPSFKMKPLVTMQHSPLNSILQKFNKTSHQNNTESKILLKSPENNVCLLKCLTQPNLIEKDITPNGKQILHPSPPATPKKRITLMERLAENRAKRRDTLIRTVLEN